MDLARASGKAFILSVTTLIAAPAGAQSIPPPPPGAPPSAPAAPPTPPHDNNSREAGNSAAPGAGMTPVPAPTPAEVRFRRMAVDVETTRPNAILERRVSVKESVGAWFVLPTRNVESTWEQVCVAPCQGADLDRYSTYRVAQANWISGSPSFTLPQGGDTIHLKLEAGSSNAHHVGITMSTIGGAAVIVGSIMIATADNFTKQNDVRDAGWITAGSGLLFLAIGLPLTLLTTTKVYADSGRRVAKSAHWTPTGYVF